MLWLLVLYILLVGCSSRILAQDLPNVEGHSEEEVSVAAGPHIYYCRSPNMEDFTCWWHPLDNSSHGDDDVTYVFTYSKDMGPKYECPDYVTGGPHSCHFDSSCTSIWKPYCMSVAAITAHRNYTSQEHCLDVADIVQMEAPVNLTYTLEDPGEDEMGHMALVTWAYPVPKHIQFGWITLVYELQYRHLTEPDNWKVKQHLREPHLELLGLPVGEYVVRVRCRSQNYGLWSKWSSSILMTIPFRPAPGKLLAMILVTGVGVVALLVIGCGFIPQSKRLKAFLLPPIPKPRIIGIDPLFLKMGHMDEINRHLSSFHGYSPPSYSEELWDQISMGDSSCPALHEDLRVQVDRTDKEVDALIVPPSVPTPVAAAKHQLVTPVTPAGSFLQSPSPYCASLSEAFAQAAPVPVPDVPAVQWPWIMSLPGTDHSVMGDPSQPAAPSSVPLVITAATTTTTTTRPPAQDFYTCIHLMNDSGEVHLVPCLAPALAPGTDPQPPHLMEEPEGNGKEEKRQQLADYVAGKMEKRVNVRAGPADGEKAEQGDVAVPLLPAY